MKKQEPFSIYQVALVMYIVIISLFVMVLGVITLITKFLWLVGIIVAFPLAIWAGLSIKRYLYEGGLEDDFVSNKNKQ